MSGDHLRDADYDGPCVWQEAEKRIAELEAAIRAVLEARGLHRYFRPMDDAIDKAIEALGGE